MTKELLILSPDVSEINKLTGCGSVWLQWSIVSFIFKFPKPKNENTSSCLDKITTNIPNYVQNINVTTPVANSDHCTVSANLLFRRKKSPCFKRSVWDYKHANFDTFREKLFDVDWDACFDSDNIDVITDLWTDTFLKCAENSIPHKDVTIRPDDVPWYTNSLRALKRKIHRIHKKAKKRPALLPYFRQLRNTYIENLRLAEQAYYQRLEDSVNSTATQKKTSWWQTVKFFLNKNQTTDIPSLCHENQTVTDNEAKAQLLNEFFVSHATVDDSNFHLPPTHNIHCNLLRTIVASETEVQNILESLDVSKANGPDGISARLLREGAPAISKSLAKLFNFSLDSHRFPSQWKRANVVPIFKKGCPSSCNSYRPISLLNIVSKVFEKVVFKHVFNFFRDNAVLSECQSGFIPGDSTVNQLLYLYHHFCEAVDLQKEVRVVFCDITKAFDRVYHPGLLFKLRNAGIEGPLLSWFADYLDHRQQRVVVQGGTSPWSRVRAGVPQGSVLGPLLFLIYINDIVNIVNSPIRLFADDTTLFITVDDPVVAANSLNSDLHEVENWASKWLVLFNPSKTSSMIISKKRVPKDHPNLTFMNTPLHNEQEHKHLGLVLRSDLSWTSHINELVTKGMKMVNIMKYLQFRLSRKALETLYFSFVRPLLEYGSVVWDGCSINDCNQLEKVNLAAARIVTGATVGTNHNLLYQESGFETLAERRSKSKLITFYKILNGDAPRYLKEMLPTSVRQRNRYNVRTGYNLSLIRARTNLFNTSFFPSTVRLWNDLPPATRNAEYLDEFKGKLNHNKPKANPLFYIGSRRASVLQARLRMKCSMLKADLFKNGLIDCPKCACGIANEDDFHYFVECAKFRIERDRLQNAVIPLAPFTVQTLLFG